jgi:serine/threonine-protein kinase HipA
MNPSFNKDEHVLSLNLNNRLPYLDIALSTSENYRVEIGCARKIVSAVCNVVEKWKARARKLGLTTRECTEAEHLFTLPA